MASAGEGGGQVLRTALTLSMITGQPFRIDEHPRQAREARPDAPAPGRGAGGRAGQRRAVTGAEVGSQALTFAPSAITAGDYEFAIGTAGSCTLVLQTILPALLFGDAPSTVRITGGTHNPMAPPVQFLQRAYCRVLRDDGGADRYRTSARRFLSGRRRRGARIGVALRGLRPLELLARGKRVAGYAESIVAGVPASVARRELECVGAGMGWDEPQLLACTLARRAGAGQRLADHA